MWIETDKIDTFIIGHGREILFHFEKTDDQWIDIESEDQEKYTTYDELFDVAFDMLCEICDYDELFAIEDHLDNFKRRLGV
jgi:hypothetical protein